MHLFRPGFLRRLRRWPYRRAMFRAINLACDNGPRSMYANDLPPKYGLCVIKKFEKVNRLKFNPFNSEHVSRVAYSRHLATLHYLRTALKRWRRDLDASKLSVS